MHGIKKGAMWTACPNQELLRCSFAPDCHSSNVTEPTLPTMQYCYCVTSLETID